MIQGLYKMFDKWHEKGTCHIISDTHFGDKDLTVGVKNRPSDDELVRMINAKCGRADTLIHLGDVGDIAYIQKLKAKHKILVMGNHDTGRSNYERKTWTIRFDKDRYSKQEAITSMMKAHPGCSYTVFEGCQLTSPFEYWDVVADNMLFDEVYEGPLMIAEKLILSHEPVDVPWAFNIHGHVHDKRHKNDKLHFNACLDATGYEVINFNQWMKQGHLANVETLHRDTINTATKRKIKRGNKKIGEK